MKVNIENLIKIQNEISSKVKLKKFKKKIEILVAFDVSFDGDIGYCCGVVLDEKFNILKKEFVKKKAEFPYIPTFLAFRELEFINEVYKKFDTTPDIVLIDGQGLAHPRRCGIATHFGVVNNIPAIGVAKSHLYGKYNEPENKRFASSYLYDDEKNIIGAVLRTKENTKPIFISPGNLIDVDSSIEIIKSFTTKYKIPEPLRLAHILSNKFRKNCF